MARQHYLPATYLASFSSENILPRRKRKIVQGDKKTGKVAKGSAESFAHVKDLYTLLAPTAPGHSARNPALVDNIWSKYERELATVIQRLIDRSLTAIEWARTLVPFVTCLLIRHPEFTVRFNNRLMGLSDVVPADNVNTARTIELQRLLGPVLAAEWIVSEVGGAGNLITNDLGFAPFMNSIRQVGLAVPISHRYVLQVIPRRSRQIIEAKNGEWFPIIKYLPLEPDNHEGLNKALDAIARRFIYGENEKVVRQLLTTSGPTPPLIPEPRAFGFISGRLAVVHEHTWYRLISLLSKHPDSDQSYSFDIDFAAVPAGWAPVFWAATNLPQFRPALTRSGNIISVEFFEVAGFTVKTRSE